MKMTTATVYGAELPAIDVLTAALELRPLENILPSFISSTGFLPHPVTNELVTPIAGGYLFTLRRDEKIIPKEEIARQTKDRAEMAEIKLDRNLTKAEMETLKHNIMAELASRAFYKTKLVECLYDETNKILLLANTSGDLADITLSCLIGTLGKVETRTIHVDDLKNGLTTRLKNFVREDEPDNAAFGELTAEQEVSLKRSAGEDEFTAKNVDLQISREVREALDNGCQVAALRLKDDLVSVRVTDKFKLQAIKWPDKTEEEETDDEPMDKVEAYRLDAASKMAALVGFINTMTAMFKVDGEENESAGN